MTKDALLALLQKYRLRPNKELGQHYLVDALILSRIVEAAAITANEPVIEIGAGPGILTQALARAGADVLAVEFDRTFCRLLQEEYHNWRNVHVLCDDALRLDFGKIDRSKIVANIPYQITNPLVRKILEPGSQIKKAILLIQAEVADRLTAKPGSSERGLLTVMVEYCGKAEVLFSVPPAAFWPSPSVHSAVIKIERSGSIAELSLKEESAFFWLVKQGFSGKRKTLANSLAGSLRLPKEEATAIVEASSINPLWRAEDLRLADWLKLFTAYSERYGRSEVDGNGHPEGRYNEEA